MFDQKSLNTLEYPKILAELAGQAQSEGGKAKAMGLVPFVTLTRAEHALDETSEADRVLFEYSMSPSFAIENIGDSLVKAKKGSVLSIGELMKVGRALRVSRRRMSPYSQPWRACCMKTKGLRKASMTPSFPRPKSQTTSRPSLRPSARAYER